MFLTHASFLAYPVLIAHTIFPSQYVCYSHHFCSHIYFSHPHHVFQPHYACHPYYFSATVFVTPTSFLSHNISFTMSNNHNIPTTNTIYIPVQCYPYHFLLWHCFLSHNISVSYAILSPTLLSLVTKLSGRTVVSDPQYLCHNTSSETHIIFVVYPIPVTHIIFSPTLFLWRTECFSHTCVIARHTLFPTHTIYFLNPNSVTHTVTVTPHYFSHPHFFCDPTFVYQPYYIPRSHEHC